MLWQMLSLAALAGLVALHFHWRARLRQTQKTAQDAIARLQQTFHQSFQEQRSHQEILFDSIVEGVLLLDPSGRIQLANRAFSALFGVSTELAGKTLMEGVRLHELNELVQSLDTQKQVLGFEFKLSRPVERSLEINGAAVLNSAGNRLGTILVFHDLTRIRQLERARQEFVANVSHELRTPLSLIKGYVETLLDGASSNPEVAGKFLHTIDRNAERLRLLIEDLLTISELESGRVKLDLDAVRLIPVTEKVIADFKARAALKKITLVSRCDDLAVRADAGRLEQILCNLVDNAIKYGRVEGAVTINAQPGENALVEIRVQDDGPGIPAESLERVFERFYRLDKARSREQGGTGLGLSIVKHLVQNQGGRAWVTSEPGQGACFHFTLPPATTAPAQASPGSVPTV